MRSGQNLLARVTVEDALSPLLENPSKIHRVVSLGGTTSTALFAENARTLSPRPSSTSSTTHLTASVTTISSMDHFVTPATAVSRANTSKQTRDKNSTLGALHASLAVSFCGTAILKLQGEGIASDMPRAPRLRRETTSDLEITDHETYRNVERDS